MRRAGQNPTEAEVQVRKTKLLLILFFNFGPLKESIFLTTIYGLYFGGHESIKEIKTVANDIRTLVFASVPQSVF